MKRLLLAAAVLFAGCFTEVGNPDDPAANVKVEMSFSVDYRSRPLAKLSANDISIDHFYLDVYDAEYWRDGAKRYLTTKSGEEWNDQNGNFTDITGKDTTALLPTLYADSGNWDIFYFSTQVKDSVKLNPEKVDFTTFAQKRWMKGSVARSGGDLDFLYELPQITRLYLVMRDTTLAKKRTAEGYRLDVAFRARWFRDDVPWDSVTTVKDKHGHPFALLSPTSNAAWYPLLKENFRRAFQVDTAQIDGVEPAP